MSTYVHLNLFKIAQLWMNKIANIIMVTLFEENYNKL